MNDIEIYFVGGTSSVWTDISKEATDNMVRWLDDKDDTKTLKFNFTNHNKLACLRKELILFINIVSK